MHRAAVRVQRDAGFGVADHVANEVYIYDQLPPPPGAKRNRVLLERRTVRHLHDVGGPRRAVVTPQAPPWYGMVHRVRALPVPGAPKSHHDRNV